MVPMMSSCPREGLNAPMSLSSHWKVIASERYVSGNSGQARQAFPGPAFVESARRGRNACEAPLPHSEGTTPDLQTSLLHHSVPPLCEYCPFLSNADLRVACRWLNIALSKMDPISCAPGSSRLPNRTTYSTAFSLHASAPDLRQAPDAGDERQSTRPTDLRQHAPL